MVCRLKNSKRFIKTPGNHKDKEPHYDKLFGN